jgi:hypothetical protein
MMPRPQVPRFWLFQCRALGPAARILRNTFFLYGYIQTCPKAELNTQVLLH